MNKNLNLIFLIGVVAIISSFFIGYNVGNSHKFRADISDLSDDGSISVSNSSSSPASSTSSTTSTARTITASSSSATSTVTHAATSTPKQSFEYKLMQSIDSCRLNKLVADGWRIYSAGGVISLGGYATDCKTISYDGIDWVILVLEQEK